MIIGSTGYYVSPSDSVAIIAANAVDCIPYFRRRKYLKGVARSMPTSSALDRVADVISLGGRELKCYEVPTGWKFFCNLMDADKVDICGEESFGAGSSHLREKDGIWVALAWLSIMARHKKPIKEIVINHWRKFGRHFYTRYDYENLSSVQGRDVMMQLQTLIDSGLKGTAYKTETRGYVVELADNFLYLDPIDNSLAAGQGYRIIFTNKDRLVVRLSGTGSCGSTIRLYMEHFETDTENIFKDTQEMLKDLIEISLEITKIKKFTTRDAPTVVS
ncbi:hypothetical protein HZS_6411 [Henneguya salminicola]|uniref:Phosphoglucomutase-1 (Trinotate prediction) n=1 Tax=Henneguya salminicola TaxID=69463 RepID=A0A6G3MH65_HENSL|nr:hypothetical protein HZS_6411 [Henneguya salminicola]